MEKSSSESTVRQPLSRLLAGYFSANLVKIIIATIAVVLIVVVPPALGVPSRSYYQGVLVGGVLAGGVYVLVATGLTLILGVMKVVNVCHGEFVVMAAYVSFWMSRYGLDPIASLVISIPLFFAIGIPVQRFLFSRGLKFGLDAPLIVAFGLSNILQYSMLTAWSANARAVTTSYNDSVLLVGPILVPTMRLVVLAVGVLCLILMTLFLRKTYTGLAIRAIGMDWQIASHFGIDVEKVNILAYSIGLSLAAVAGAFISLVFGFTPSSGLPFVLKAFAAIVLGGIGSVPGAFVGGILLGYVETTGSFFLGGEYKDAIGFIVFFIVLLLKPSGLLGKSRTF